MKTKATLEANSGFEPVGPFSPRAPSAGQPQPGPPSPRKNRGRVKIMRQKAGRGGKTVTIISGFKGIGLPEKEKLMKQVQKACGTGGTIKEGQIEIQGDQREAVAGILREAGFEAVLAGG